MPFQGRKVGVAIGVQRCSMGSWHIIQLNCLLRANRATLLLFYGLLQLFLHLPSPSLPPPPPTHTPNRKNRQLPTHLFAFTLDEVLNLSLLSLKGGGGGATSSTYSSSSSSSSSTQLRKLLQVEDCSYHCCSNHDDSYPTPHSPHPPPPPLPPSTPLKLWLDAHALTPKVYDARFYFPSPIPSPFTFCSRPPPPNTHKAWCSTQHVQVVCWAAQHSSRPNDSALQSVCQPWPANRGRKG